MGTVPRLAGVELGGTKAIAVLADGNHIIETVSCPTVDPARTLAFLNARLLRWHQAKPLAGLGIASFGPIRLNPADPAFGQMLATPKQGWSGAAIAGPIIHKLPCPWRIDTDVNAAALGEYLWGAGQGCDSLCYITIGTGVGGGLAIGGQCVHGALHPEIGHLRLRRVPGDPFPGSCAFHGDCIEGLISGPALAARFGMPSATIPDDHPGWAHVAADLAELAGTIMLATSPNRILFGGTVSIERPFLLETARRIAVERFGSYLPFLTEQSSEEMIRLAGLGTQAGPLGSIALAWKALAD